MEEFYWDGQTEPDIGHVVHVNGMDFENAYYPSIPHGQKATIIAKDLQQQTTEVFIVRWYDDNEIIRLCPVVKTHFQPYSKTSAEAKQFADMFNYLHNVHLNEKDVQKVFDKLKEVEQDVSQDAGVEVTIWTSAGLDLLVGKTPLTVKLWSSDYTVDDGQIGISVEVLAVATNSNITPAQKGAHYWFDIPNQATFE